MKSISVPDELHGWLYSQTDSEHKSLYAVIQELREFKAQHITVANGGPQICIMKYVGDKPCVGAGVALSGECVTLAVNGIEPIGVRKTDIGLLKSNQITVEL